MEGSAVPAPDTASVTPTLPSTSTGTVESQRALTIYSPVVETTLEFGSGPGCGRPPNYYLARFSAIFRIAKSINPALRYRNFADFYGFFEKIVKNV